MIGISKVSQMILAVAVGFSVATITTGVFAADEENTATTSTDKNDFDKHPPPAPKLRKRLRKRERSLQTGGGIAGGDYNEWWYGDYDDDYDHYYPPPAETWCYPDDKPENGSSCSGYPSGITCVYNKNESGSFTSRCRCEPETTAWNCGDPAPLPTPPTPPPTDPPVMCGDPAGCTVSKPLCAPGVYCEDVPGRGGGGSGNTMTAPNTPLLPPPPPPPTTTTTTNPNGGGGGIDFDVNSAVIPSPTPGTTTVTTTTDPCIPNENPRDGTYVCTITATIPTASDTNSITGNNEVCVYSPSMQSSLCFTTKIVMDRNGDGIVSEHDTDYVPEDKEENSNGSTAAGLPAPTTPAPPDNEDNYNDSGKDSNYYHGHNTALDWRGSGSGVCPETKPTHGDLCAQHVGNNESQRSCTYNGVQCRCALHNYVNEITGWSCRDVRPSRAGSTSP